MLDTYLLMLTNSWRMFKKNFIESPILYLLFFGMTALSVLMIAGISLIFVRLGINLSLNDLFFIVFGMFLLKTSYDFYRLFITNKAMVYALSTQKKQSTVVAEISLSIIWSNLGFWVLFSGVYTLLIMNFPLGFNGTNAYLLLTFAVLFASIVGITFTLFLFSTHRFLLAFLGLPLYFVWTSFYVLTILVCFFIYCIIFIFSLKNVLDSYVFQQQKNRSHKNENVHFPGSFRSVFIKESLFLWRERLLLSIIFSAGFIGVSSGYLSVYGESLFIPDEILLFTSHLSTETYALVGSYVLIVYSSVFITLNVFLNEEKKVWLLKQLPVNSETFVIGKISVLLLSFIASIPFLAFFIAFTEGESAFSIILLYVFSFLCGVILAAPLGSKYIGGTSDILLLYSVSLLMLLIIGINFAAIQFALTLGVFASVFLIGFTLTLLLLLKLSIKISSFYLDHAKNE